eukprot:1188211-Prorocentrum_minimum.AAC.2
MKYNRVASRSYCTLARRDARALEASSVHAEMPGERKERKKKVANVADPQEPEARIWRWLRGPAPCVLLRAGDMKSRQQLGWRWVWDPHCSCSTGVGRGNVGGPDGWRAF